MKGYLMSLYNKLLLDKDREQYQPFIDQVMWKELPDLMARKFPRANVQQAWMYNTVNMWAEDDSKILCVGYFEDSAFELLNLRNSGKSWLLIDNEIKEVEVSKNNWFLTGCDAAVDFDLYTYRNYVPPETFDIIFATSVIEHVEDDERFLKDICQLLKQGGIGILTMDYNNLYKPGDKLPYTDVRFYTQYDLLGRLREVLWKNYCDLIEEIYYDGEPDFEYDGCKYSFATYVFAKELVVE